MPLSRWSSRHEKTFGKKKKEKWDGNFRKPPKPDSYYTQTKGHCRWCSKVILNEDGTINTRKSWHPHCADEYMLMYHPGEARKRLWQRDGGCCAGCGDVFPRKSRHHDLKWHVDHIKPLWEQKGKTFEEIDLDYWREDNLQTLCTECHTKKTSAEATERAKLRKEDK